jgi:hypothetical protein
MRRAFAVGILLGAACLPGTASLAAPINLATLSCDKYENEIVGSPDGGRSADDPAPRGPVETPAAAPRPDAIDTVMWLFGFSVAKAGDHVMYGEALAAFGFALDAECRSNPRTSLLQALTAVRPKRDRPMDLSALNCGTFESRHADSVRTDPDSARTIMMWLFGYSVGLSGSHVFDPDGVDRFASALQAECTRSPNHSLFDVLSALSRPGQR